MNKLLTFAAGVFLLTASCLSHAVTVNVRGMDYEIIIVQTSYELSTDLLEDQPWWGDEDLAYELAVALDVKLGTFPNHDGSIEYGPALAWTTEPQFLAVVSKAWVSIYGSVANYVGFGMSDIWTYAILDNGRVPVNYGLFIGAEDRTDDTSFRFAYNAKRIAAAFDARPNTVVKTLTGDVESDPIRHSDIRRELQRIRSKMRVGDSLTLYINNHGASQRFRFGNQEPLNDEGTGDEFILVGERLYDNSLADMLQAFDGFRVTVFLDTCHGGGFWGGSDPYEYDPPGAGINDLNALSNIALYAAATETREGYGVGSLTFWGTALREAFRAPWEWSPFALASYLEVRTRQLAGLKFQNPVWYTAGYGDPVTPDMSLIETFSDHSVDYDFEGTLFEGPEPDGQFSELLGLVEGVGPGTSLFDKVSEAQGYFESDDTYAACAKLNAFTNQVSAQSGKIIPSDIAISIQAHAEFTMSALECTQQL